MVRATSQDPSDFYSILRSGRRERSRNRFREFANSYNDVLSKHAAQIGFLENLVKVFPSLATRPFYLTGESYAGRYIVSLSM